jgi:hypothetical protein
MAPAPTPDRRAALQRFEEAYARWSASCQALTAAELRLWAEALRDRGSARLPALAEEVVRLRERACAAYEDMLPLLQALD